MEDIKLDIDGKRLWSATILLVEPYRDTNQDFTAPEGTQARVVTTNRSFLTSLSPRDFAKNFGFSFVEHDNVAINPYHVQRKTDGSYTFQVEEAGPNVITRDGAKAYTRLSYRAGGEKARNAPSGQGTRLQPAPARQIQRPGRADADGEGGETRRADQRTTQRLSGDQRPLAKFGAWAGSRRWPEAGVGGADPSAARAFDRPMDAST
jgi:hypothetical protein